MHMDLNIDVSIDEYLDISNQDALAWLKTIDTESVDLVITDPPYESLEKYRNIGTTTKVKTKQII